MTTTVEVFADITCPASSVYAAHNVVPGPKRLVLDPQAGHGGRDKPDWERALLEFVQRHSTG